MPRKRKYQTSSQKNGAKVKQLKLQFKVDRPLIEKGIRSVITVLALSVLAGEADGHNHEELEEQLNLVEEEVLADPLFEQGILCVDFCVGAERALPPGIADAHGREELKQGADEAVEHWQADPLIEKGIYRFFQCLPYVTHF